MTLLDVIKDSQLVKGEAAKEVAEKFGDKQGERENEKRNAEEYKTLWKGRKKKKYCKIFRELKAEKIERGEAKISLDVDYRTRRVSGPQARESNPLK